MHLRRLRRRVARLAVVRRLPKPVRLAAVALLPEPARLAVVLLLVAVQCENRPPLEDRRLPRLARVSPALQLAPVSQALRLGG